LNILLIAGPTAVGKTSLSIELAERLGCEIISADSRQFYKELNAGTAKPSADDLRRVKHHFINSHSIDEVVDAGTYERLALDKIDELSKNYNQAILVGGSGLYVQAILEGLDAVEIRDEELRAELNELSTTELQTRCKKVDAAYYATVDVQNRQRLMRAIEVSEISGKPFSQQRTAQKKNRNFTCLKIALNTERSTLYARINERVDKMLLDGLEQEAREFMPFRNTYALQTLGYTEFFDFFDAKCSYADAVSRIKQNSRRYAKRQITWFKRDTEMRWFDPSDKEQIWDYIKNAWNV
jgi:tRNA dimethylallyltransferase